MFGIRVTLLGIIAVAVLIRDLDAAGVTPAQLTTIYQNTTKSIFVNIDQTMMVPGVQVNAFTTYQTCLNGLQPLTNEGRIQCALRVINTLKGSIETNLFQNQIDTIKNEYVNDIARYEKEYSGFVMDRRLLRPLNDLKSKRPNRG